jgi:hypothetical protein
MENTTPEHTKFTRIMLLILAVVLLGASIGGYVISQKIGTNKNGLSTTYNPQPTTSLPTPTLIPYPVNGSITLRHTVGELRVGDPVTLDIIATSGDNDVAGYDIVLTYDTAHFKQENITSSSQDFEVFTFKRSHYTSISATKKLTAKSTTQFANSTIISATFIPRTKGIYVFSLKPVGNESSKFVSETAAVTYPETQDISLEIK